MENTLSILASLAFLGTALVLFFGHLV